MHRLLLVLPLLALAGCVTRQTSESAPQWRIEFEGGAPVHMDMEWLETARFQEPRDAWRAMLGVADSPNHAGMGYIQIHPNLMFQTERDDKNRIYLVKVLERENFCEYAKARAGNDAKLIETIHAAPSFHAAEKWDPATMVRVANKFLALGESEASRILNLYLDVYADWATGLKGGLLRPSPGNVMAIAMLLWSGDQDGISPGLGGGLPEYLENKLELIHMVGNLPFATCMGFNLGGLAESADGYIKRVRAEGHWRTEPLVPVDNPFAEFLDFEKWLRQQGREAGVPPNPYWFQFLRTQCLRCVEIDTARSWNLLIDNSVIPMLATGADQKGLCWSREHEWYELPE